MSTPIEFLTTRRSIPALFLGPPAPDAAQLRQILAAAVRVPDHGKLAPWRFVLLQGDRRAEAGEALLQLRLGRGDSLSDEQRAAERARFTRAPMVIALVSRPQPSAKAPEWEQQLSAGAVGMNLLNGAHALGFAAQWLTDWPVYDAEARALLGLQDTERLAGFIHIGTPKTPPQERPRANPEDLLTEWTPPSGV